MARARSSSSSRVAAADLLGRALWSVSLVPAFRSMLFSPSEGWRTTPRDLAPRGAQGASKLAAQLGRLPPDVDQRLAELLRTPEMQELVTTLLAQELTRTGTGIAPLRQAFVAIIRRELSVDEVTLDAFKLFEQLVAASDVVLFHPDQPFMRGGEDRYASDVCQERLASSAGMLRCLLDERAPSRERIGAIVTELRSHARRVHGEITPPSFEEAARVPIDDLYVSPHFEIAEADESWHFDFETLKDRSYRIVLIGDPGAGKSTFTDKLCFDLASCSHDEPAPIVVVLRRYVAHSPERRSTLFKYILHLVESRYGVRVTAIELESLLALGRLLVVFDGLDELPDLSRRRAIRDEVETFGVRYAAARQVITCRRIGYEHAPLSRHRYTLVQLVDFDAAQVEAYARSWFGVSLDRDVGGSAPPDYLEAKVQGFMRESESVADLRTNALMLALLCRLYGGEGTLPRNRPEVYEKCARMLFETWDRQREIRFLATLEQHLPDVMQHLAYWIYSNPELQSGVTEAELIEETKSHLREWVFERDAEARGAAQSLIDFCRGRAWVFSDLGTSGVDQPVFQFTHRTFLEFFAAQFLVGGAADGSALLDALAPRVQDGDWDVVGQLACQLLSRGRRGSADELLRGLLDRAADQRGKRADELYSFTLRTLAVLSPRPETTRHTVDRIANYALTRSLIEQMTEPVDSEITPTVLVGGLLGLLEETRAPAYDEYARALRTWLSDPDPERALVGIRWALRGPSALGRVVVRRAPDELLAVLEELWDAGLARAVELAPYSTGAAAEALAVRPDPGLLGDAIDAHGLDWLLIPREVASGTQPELSALQLALSVADEPDALATVVVEHFGAQLLSPATVRAIWANGSTVPQQPLTPVTKDVAAILLAALMEWREGRNTEVPLLLSGRRPLSILLGDIRRLLTSWRPSSGPRSIPTDREARAALRDVGVGRHARDVLLRWAKGELPLVATPETASEPDAPSPGRTGDPSKMD